MAQEPPVILPPGRENLRKAPVVSVGFIGWIKNNLFSTWYNTLFTILGLYILYLAVPPFFQWAILDAVWSGEDRTVCEWYDEDKVKHRAGACWLMVKVYFNFFTYGFYPDELQWRINLAFAILAVSTALMFIPNFKKKHYVGIFLFVGYPFIAFFLLSGSESLGLEYVSTHKWGGLFLTFLLGNNKMKISNVLKNNNKKKNYDKIFINLINNKKINIFIKNNWKSPTKVRLIKFIFEKATIYCDENETLYKIKIYKSFKNRFNEHTLEVPKIDLTEPLNNLAHYILKTLNKRKKIIFNDKFNLSITKLMVLLDKK